MISFAWLWLVLLLPLPFLIKRKPQAQASGHLQLPGAASRIHKTSHNNTNLSNKGSWFIWLMLIAALIRPQWLGDPIDLPSRGRDLMLAVDLSGSMQIDDMVIDGKRVDRFRLIQHVLSEFIERRQGDRLGLILFADHAYLQSPLTQDRRSIAQFLKEAQIGLVGKQTAIGEAIGLAVKRFDKIEQSNRVLILLTDGTNNAGSITPEQAAEIAKQRNITIYTIGVGAEVLERRSFFGTERVNPSSDLDETQLSHIASLTGGQYFRARNTEELQEIYQAIDQLEPVSREQLSYRPKTELFYWPLAIGLILSCLQYLASLHIFTKPLRRPKS